MKLLYKSTIYFFLFSTFAFISGGAIFYLKAKSIIYNQIDFSLITEKNIIEQQIIETNEIPDFRELFFEHIIEVKIFEFPVREASIIKDTSIYNKDQDNYHDYRMIEFTSNTPEREGYLIRIFQSIENKKDLLEFIGLSLFIMFSIILLAALVINYGISKNLWHNFNDSLDKISKFDISSAKLLNLSETSIQEFQQLNNVLTHMSVKMQKDYLSLKEFNENASHEIQTPLAIIRSHLELLFQFENLNEAQLRSLNTIAESVNRLSKLNQGLLLISKIDNQQFKTTESVSINILVNRLLNDFEEIIRLKNIRIEKEFETNVTMQMNTMLAEILISNLISNAVRYNFSGGFIKFLLNEKTFSVINTGLPLKTDPGKLFERFWKENHSAESVGLGLSIVKSITDYYGMEVHYIIKDENLHEIVLAFHKEIVKES